MKNLIKTASVLLMTIFFSLSASAGKEVVTDSFKVSGNCEMCKETIEEAADIKGVKSTTWNMETGMLTVTYDSSKVQLITIHKKIAEAGYDTELAKADEATYQKLPRCCKYRKD